MGKTKRETTILTNIQFTLAATLDELRVSMNQLSIQSGVRPATVIALCNGTSKKIDLLTLQMLLDTINILSQEYNIGKKYTIENIIRYVPK